MHTCFSDPKAAACAILRVGFGLSLTFLGITHYMDFGSFSIMVSDGLGVLSVLGTIWAGIYPGLLILGGALFVIGYFSNVAAWAAGVALASIPAGMLIKPILSGVGLDQMMPPATTAFIWLLVYMAVVRCVSMRCGSACGCGGNCGCAGCTCGTGNMPSKSSKPMAASASAPMSTMKPAPKKPMAKKS